MTRFAWWFVLPSLLILSGCASSSVKAFTGQDLNASVILNSLAADALGQSAGAAWIADKEGLRSIMDKFNQQKIGGSSMSLPEIDYQHEGVLLIRMGRKPTGGYGIELASEKVSIRDQVAIVTVRWVEPAKDAILAQMITSPCIMVKLARGSYDRVQVVDQKGIVRAETMVETHMR